MTEAGQIAATDDFDPALEIFRTLVCTFRSNVDEFMLRVEQRHKELETLANVHGFCQQVCVGFCSSCPVHSPSLLTCVIFD